MQFILGVWFHVLVFNPYALAVNWEKTDSALADTICVGVWRKVAYGTEHSIDPDQTLCWKRGVWSGSILFSVIDNKIVLILTSFKQCRSWSEATFSLEPSKTHLEQNCLTFTFLNIYTRLPLWIFVIRIIKLNELFSYEKYRLWLGRFREWEIWELPACPQDR